MSNATRAALTAIVKDFRRGSLVAEAELAALGSVRLDDLAQAWGRERAPEELHAQMAELLEKDGASAVAEKVATHVEHYDRKDARKARETKLAAGLRVLEPEHVSTDSVLAACDTPASFIAVPVDSEIVCGIGRAKLRAFAQLVRKESTTWWVDTAERALVCSYKTARGRGRVLFRIDAIDTAELAKVLPPDELAAKDAIRAALAAPAPAAPGPAEPAAAPAEAPAPVRKRRARPAPAPVEPAPASIEPAPVEPAPAPARKRRPARPAPTPQPAAPAPSENPPAHYLVASSTFDRVAVLTNLSTPGWDPTTVLDALRSEVVALRAENEQLRAARPVRRPTSDPSTAAARALETKRVRRLARKPGECLARNGGRPMKHTRDCPGCRPTVAA